MKINKTDLAKMDLFRIVRRYVSDNLAYSLIQILDFDKIMKLISKFKNSITKYTLKFSDDSKTEYQNLKMYLSDLEKISILKQRILESL